MKTDFKVSADYNIPIYCDKITNRTNDQFSNLLGTVYCRGNLLFSPDGTHLYSPVGNRVTVFNLVEYVVANREPLTVRCDQSS